MLHRRTVTQIPWPLDNHVVRKVEAWGKKGARAIKRGCMCASKRTGRCVGREEDGMVHDPNSSVQVGALLVKHAGWCMI